jgi:hypothetical protein
MAITKEDFVSRTNGDEAEKAKFRYNQYKRRIVGVPQRFINAAQELNSKVEWGVEGACDALRQSQKEEATMAEAIKQMEGSIAAMNETLSLMKKTLAGQQERTQKLLSGMKEINTVNGQFETLLDNMECQQAVEGLEDAGVRLDNDNKGSNEGEGEVGSEVGNGGDGKEDV